MSELVHDLIINAAWKNPGHPALCCADQILDYGRLCARMQHAGQAMLSLGVRPRERVAVLLDKRADALLAMFGTLDAGAAFVPIDPMLKAEQVGQILRDSCACVLVTTPGRRLALAPTLAHCPALRCVLQTGSEGAAMPGLAVFGWDACLGHGGELCAPRVPDTELAALLYQCGASGKPERTGMSHRTLLDCASQLGERLGRRALRRSLSLLPYCDAGGIALLAASFATSAATLLLNQVLARDMVQLVGREGITTLAAPPWLWMQVAALDWQAGQTLRCIISAGGTLPTPTLDALKRRLPLAQVFVMHGRNGGDTDMLLSHPGLALASPLTAIH
jgi:acyl-CoA synthetase (AMP-forming)/AMP-acid ligase II